MAWPFAWVGVEVQEGEEEGEQASFSWVVAEEAEEAEAEASSWLVLEGLLLWLMMVASLHPWQEALAFAWA